VSRSARKSPLNFCHSQLPWRQSMMKISTPSSVPSMKILLCSFLHAALLSPRQVMTIPPVNLKVHLTISAHSPAFQDFQDDEDMQEPKAHNLNAFSKMILQRKKLSDRATADFNIYCEVSTPFHRFYITILMIFVPIPPD